MHKRQAKNRRRGAAPKTLGAEDSRGLLSLTICMNTIAALMPTSNFNKIQLLN